MNTFSKKTVRLDKWLWAARFFKTRSLAKAAINGGKIYFHPSGRLADKQKPKVSKEINIGDRLTIRRGDYSHTIEVIGLSEKRGNSISAGSLYEENVASIEAREAEKTRKKMENLGLQIPNSRPSKSDRKALLRLKHGR